MESILAGEIWIVQRSLFMQILCFQLCFQEALKNEKTG